MKTRHNNAELFPDPKTFDPSRWTVGLPEEIRARERALVPFSKGSRNCVGQNLAMGEIYCTLAALFHRFDDLQIGPNFGREDFEMIELLFGYQKKGSRQFSVVQRRVAKVMT